MSDAVNQMAKDTKEWDFNKPNNLVSGTYKDYEQPSPFPKEFQKPHGMRYNDGKLKWSYVHYESLEPMVRVLMFGAQKYEPFNWQKGLKKDEILESMQRHLGRMMDGETNDPESGLNHIGHIMCNAMFWSYMDLMEQRAKQQTIDELNSFSSQK